MKNQRNIPEILAPAGTLEALHAAINAGCDAVYLGGDLFSARAFAGNFDRAALLQALDDCHLFGVKLYMTVNTLLKDRELEQLVSYMEPFYRAGLDGVIVQDLGVVRVLHRNYPDLPLHASTQMSIASGNGANFLKRCGIVRIVPARELSLQEIRAMKDESGMEVETFVHGAMCYAYSGKCLFSSFLGGRSGNRGRCAQPCRKCYSFSPDAEGGKEKKAYLMSLKDMCTLAILPQLIDAGIDSFKIEGRMKNPSYVAATVDAYRQARDLYLAMRQAWAEARPEASASEGRFRQDPPARQEQAEARPEASASEGRFRQDPPVRQEQAEARPEAPAGEGPYWEDLPAAQQQRYLAAASRLTGDMQDIYNRGGFYSGYYFTEKGLEMTAADRPNHAGRRIGRVESIQGPEVRLKLQEDVHPQDVLEIRQTGTELTSNTDGTAGSSLRLKGKDLKRLKPGMEVYRTRNHTLLQRIERDIIEPEKTIPAQARIIAREGEPLTITISAPGKPTVSVTGNPVQAAGSKPVEADQLMAKMQKTGGSHVSLTAACSADENIFVPMSEFNALRREAVEQWKEAIVRSFHRKHTEDTEHSADAAENRSEQ